MMIMIAYLLHSQQSVVMTNHIDSKSGSNLNFVGISLVDETPQN